MCWTTFCAIFWSNWYNQWNLTACYCNFACVIKQRSPYPASRLVRKIHPLIYHHCMHTCTFMCNSITEVSLNFRNVCVKSWRAIKGWWVAINGVSKLSTDRQFREGGRDLKILKFLNLIRKKKDLDKPHIESGVYRVSDIEIIVEQCYHLYSYKQCCWLQSPSPLQTSTYLSPRGSLGREQAEKNHSFFPSRNQTEKLHMPPHFYDFGESSASLQRISYMDVESCVIGVLGSSQYRKTQQTVEI